MTFLQPDYLPDGTVDKLDLRQMKADGVNGLILDLDNTIMKPRSGQLSAEVSKWLQKAVELDFRLIIVTNNTNQTYLQSLTPLLQALKLPIICCAGKPRRGKLEEALSYLKLPPSEVCVVGDRVLTDVLGGARLSMKTAFVRPLLGEEENVIFKLLRKLEMLFLGVPEKGAQG